MGRPIKTTKTATVDTGYNNPAGYGIVGGDAAIATPQILCRVKIGANAEAPGYIIRQKGNRKYLVSDGTNTGTCVLADLADTTLTDDTMTVTITKLDTTTTRLAKFGDSFGIDFTGTGYYLTFNAAEAVPIGGIYEVAQVASA